MSNLQCKRLILTLLIIALFYDLSFCISLNDKQPSFDVKLGVSASFNLNIPDTWESVSKHNELTNLKYGVGLGVIVNCSLKNKWVGELSAIVNYDNLLINQLEEYWGNFGRYNVEFPVLIGYKFSLDNDFTISPLLGVCYSQILKVEQYNCSSSVDLSNSGFATGFGVKFGQDKYCVKILSMLGITKLFPNGNDLLSGFKDNKISVSACYFF